jgi:hypothetical protein
MLVAAAAEFQQVTARYEQWTLLGGSGLGVGTRLIGRASRADPDGIWHEGSIAG